MLLKLTPSDDLPLTLGARVPRPEELDAGIVELQKLLGELDEQIAKNRGVQWVPDDRVQVSDVKSIGDAVEQTLFRSDPWRAAGWAAGWALREDGWTRGNPDAPLRIGVDPGRPEGDMTSIVTKTATEIMFNMQAAVPRAVALQQEFNSLRKQMRGKFEPW